MTMRVLDGILRGAAAGSRAALESLLTRSSVGVAVWDTHLRCAWVNETLAHLDGIPGAQRLGRPPSQALSGDADVLETVMGEVLAGGTPVIGREYPVPTAEGEGREPGLSVSFFRLDDDDGAALGVCSLVKEVTGPQWADERLARLSKACTRIGTTLDVMRTAQELADFAVPFLADYATVDLTEAMRLGEEPLARLGPMGGRFPVFRRAGLASIHPGVPESLWDRGQVVYVASTSPFTQVLTSGLSLIEPVLGNCPSLWFGLDPTRAEKIREHGMHSLMVVPMHARGAILGVAVFVRTDNPEPFQEDDLLLAEELVARAALSLDNASRYTRERTTALALQQSLLPRRVTGGSALDVVTRYLPADVEEGVGGDWYDVIALPGARTALVVGDVVGHGVQAAAAMGRLRMAVQTLADLDLAPGELLTHLNNVVSRLADEESGDMGRHASPLGATCLYAVYDPVTHTCTMARAGHPPPAILLPDGSVTVPDVPAGTPLGLATLPYEATEIQLPEKSVISLFTDGLIEDRHRDIDAGMDRLTTALAQPGVSLDDLSSAMIDILPADTPSDDVTLVLARTRSLNPAQAAVWDLAADPAAVSTARTMAVGQLASWGLQKLATSTELIVSELVTNAILHATGPIRLRLIRHRVLVCEVVDHSSIAPHLRRAHINDESGRGLFLVAQLARRWGTRHLPDGKLVWAEQTLPTGFVAGGCDDFPGMDPGDVRWSGR